MHVVQVATHTHTHTHTHPSLADVAALPADDVVDDGAVVEPVDQAAATGVHQGVLQSAEQDPVQLLHVMLAGLLNTHTHTHTHTLVIMDFPGTGLDRQ